MEMEETEMEEMEMEEIEMEEMEMEEMEMVMGTEENMAITSEDLCLLEKKYQVKYASCTLLNSALTWWNSHKRTIGNEAAYAMSWAELMKLMTEVYYKKLQGYAARSAESKRRMESNPRDNRGQQPPFKRQNISGQNVVRAYTTGNKREKGLYGDYYPKHSRELQLESNNSVFIVTSVEDRDILGRIALMLCDITPSTLDTSYAIELADGRISETNVVLRGCTLGLLGHAVDIDIMPLAELGKFPTSSSDPKVIFQKGCQVYLAQVTSKKAEDKSEEKRLEDVPIIREFLEVFPDDLPGLPPMLDKTPHYSRIRMNRVCKPYLDRFRIVFIDDILIYSKSRKEHEGHLRLILKLLKEEKLYVKFSKCEFWLSKVQFLGHSIDSEAFTLIPLGYESINDGASPRHQPRIHQFF
ncbi:putative reverse transcriptase domain-containing protein [Tanacetum coccineum]|uniref:Reverse transcriptase domain-containing protein n=1 Tax=Tanacetum coccineum TaxID=301880 RepID=A0ABQ5GCV7_9ASTR